MRQQQCPIIFCDTLVAPARSYRPSLSTWRLQKSVIAQLLPPAERKSNLVSKRGSTEDQIRYKRVPTNANKRE